MTYSSQTKFTLFLLLWLQILPTFFATSDVEIQAVAPVNPVKQGGFLSVHCQIWNLQDHYKVTISRQLKGKTQTEMLSWGKSVLTEVSERVMLAVRTLKDGSTVYFLSILDITRHDEGTYICKVRTLSEQEQVIGTDDVYLDVNYFPEQPSPYCSPSDPMTVQEGQEIEFNCSSEAGKPHVTFEWSRTGVYDITTAANNVRTDGAYSILTFKPTARDNRVIFMCKISSAAFPEVTTQECHVGPITVVPDFERLLSSTTARTEVQKTVPDALLPTQSPSSVCRKVCSNMNSHVQYWIIATVVFSVVALIFIITGFCLLIRYYRLSAAANTAQIQVNNDAEDTYEKLEYRSDRKVYMALDKSWVPSHGQIELQTHYNVTPVNQLPSQYHS